MHPIRSAVAKRRIRPLLWGLCLTTAVVAAACGLSAAWAGPELADHAGNELDTGGEASADPCADSADPGYCRHLAAISRSTQPASLLYGKSAGLTGTGYEPPHGTPTYHGPIGRTLSTRRALDTSVDPWAIEGCALPNGSLDLSKLQCVRAWEARYGAGSSPTRRVTAGCGAENGPIYRMMLRAVCQRNPGYFGRPPGGSCEPTAREAQDAMATCESAAPGRARPYGVAAELERLTPRPDCGGAQPVPNRSIWGTTYWTCPIEPPTDPVEPPPGDDGGGTPPPPPPGDDPPRPPAPRGLLYLDLCAPRPQVSQEAFDPGTRSTGRLALALETGELADLVLPLGCDPVGRRSIQVYGPPPANDLEVAGEDGRAVTLQVRELPETVTDPPAGPPGDDGGDDPDPPPTGPEPWRFDPLQLGHGDPVTWLPIGPDGRALRNRDRDRAHQVLELPPEWHDCVEISARITPGTMEPTRQVVWYLGESSGTREWEGLGLTLNGRKRAALLKRGGGRDGEGRINERGRSDFWAPGQPLSVTMIYSRAAGTLALQATTASGDDTEILGGAVPPGDSYPARWLHLGTEAMDFRAMPADPVERWRWVPLLGRPGSPALIEDLRVRGCG